MMTFYEIQVRTLNEHDDCVEVEMWDAANWRLAADDFLHRDRSGNRHVRAELYYERGNDGDGLVDWDYLLITFDGEPLAERFPDGRAVPVKLKGFVERFVKAVTAA